MFTDIKALFFNSCYKFNCKLIYFYIVSQRYLKGESCFVGWAEVRTSTKLVWSEICWSY